MRLLLVEDDLSLAEIISKSLKLEHFQVDKVHNGEDGYNLGSDNIYDLIILDIMLPLLDGLTVLKKLRQDKVSIPVLLLTANGEISHRVEGLNSGADDYLPKPFATEELVARIKALTRRINKELIYDNLNIGDLILYTSNLKLGCKTSEVILTLKEFELIQYLMLREGMTTTKDKIIEKIWGYETDTGDNNVEVYISLIRKKLAYLNSSVKIKTLRKIGYILEK